ncbi:MAG: response regulator transcription factor [Bryobacteraceae bacterium]|nr:response regulator transcription factor [Bryobacteraceae bacterium]
MTALIIDDEWLARRELRRLLQPHPEIQVVGEAVDGEQALKQIGEHSPDLLFLDIQMPGLSGFDLLEQLGADVPQVIFTTAFDQHAVRAFEVNALDFLLKPIAPERLALALRRLAPPRPAPAQVFVRDGDRCWIVRWLEIFLLESEGNYTRLHFGAERPLIRRSLQALELQLDPRMFFRANRQQIFNLHWIEKTYLDAGLLTVTLRGGATVDLSRRQTERLKDTLSL